MWRHWRTVRQTNPKATFPANAGGARRPLASYRVRAATSGGIPAAGGAAARDPFAVIPRPAPARDAWTLELTGDPAIDQTRREVLAARRRIAEARLFAENLRERTDRAMGVLRQRLGDDAVEELGRGPLETNDEAAARELRRINEMFDDAEAAGGAQGDYASTRALGRHMGRTI